MFGFLKDKLKSALSKFSKDVETEVEPLEEKSLPPQEPQKKEKPHQKEKLHEKKEKKKHAKEEHKTHVTPKSEPSVQELVVEKKGFFSRLKDKLSSKKDQAAETPI